MHVEYFRLAELGSTEAGTVKDLQAMLQSLPKPKIQVTAFPYGFTRISDALDRKGARAWN